MNKKMLMIIAIFLFAILIFIITMQKDGSLESTQEVDTPKEDQYDYLEVREEVYQRYEELIAYCKDYQEEIGAVSEEILTILEPYPSYEELVALPGNIQNADWPMLSETLFINYPINEIEDYGNKVHFINLSKSPFILEVIYIIDDEEYINIYLGNYLQSKYGDAERINDHLYVVVKERVRE
jgi:hypothetical protein